MGWASNYILDLLAGRTVQLRAPGQSMSGRIEPKQLVTIAPVPDPLKIKVGDIGLCSVRGWGRLHLVKAVRHGSFLIASNRGARERVDEDDLRGRD